jgi:hypothetical protein
MQKLDSTNVARFCSVFEVLNDKKVLHISYHQKINDHYMVAKIEPQDLFFILVKVFDPKIQTYDFAYLVPDCLQKDPELLLQGKKYFYESHFKQILFQQTQTKHSPKNLLVFLDDSLVALRRLHRNPIIVYHNEEVIFAPGSLSNDLLQKEREPRLLGYKSKALELVPESTLLDKSLKDQIEQRISLIKKKNPNEATMISKALNVRIEEEKQARIKVEEEKQAQEQGITTWVQTTSQDKPDMIQAKTKPSQGL